MVLQWEEHLHGFSEKCCPTRELPFAKEIQFMPLFSSLNNGVITKQEFKIVNSELEQYFKLKEAVRAKLKEKTNPGPDF